MLKIKWKVDRREDSQVEGLVDGKKCFHISGRLCVTDLRESYSSMDKGESYISPSNYRISSREEGKQIAHDLLNELNLEIHEANKNAWIAEQNKTTKLIEEADKLIKSLQLKEKTQLKLDL